MDAEKLFSISNPNRSQQFVYASRELGRILLMDEVSDIVREFGSEVKRTLGDYSISIQPPIPKAKLPQFGEALVQLAHTLDPSDPMPDYDIDGKRPKKPQS